MYDMELFKNLLLSAKGEKTFREFAHQCGIHESYFSLINNNYNKPPSAKILKKIAQHSNVSFFDLLKACGYIQEVD